MIKRTVAAAIVLIYAAIQLDITRKAGSGKTISANEITASKVFNGTMVAGSSAVILWTCYELFVPKDKREKLGSYM